MVVKVSLETVTPLFLGGADPRGEPELRAASVRGALRFWLRALLGGRLGDQDLDALRKAESAVFGSTGSASPVVIRVRHGSLKKQPFSQLAAFGRGISYLFFAARGTKQEPERSAIVAGTPFELEFSERMGAATAESGEALQQAYMALWLLTHLGGLGARSRRGAGSLQAIKAEEISGDLPSLIVQANSPSELQAELRRGLIRLRSLMRSDAVAHINSFSAFDVLHPNVCKVWVINRSFKTWFEALDVIGQTMQQFRSRRPPDYRNVREAVQGRSLSQPVQRAAFGLPIIFYYRSLDGRRGTLEGETHSRRASPLMIRATKLVNGQYVLVLTLFKATLLEHGERLQLKRKGPPARIQVPDLSLIDDFLATVDNEVANRLEVKGW